LATLEDSVYFYNIVAPVSLSKKIKILTLTKIDFSEEKCHEKRLKEQF